MSTEARLKKILKSIFYYTLTNFRRFSKRGEKFSSIVVPNARFSESNSTKNEMQKTIFSLVPDSYPVALVDYYDEFSDYYIESELQTKRWLVRHYKSDWIALDIGANVGIYSIILSRLLQDGHVHAFEPTKTIEKLKSNLQAAGASNVSTYKLAFGAHTGRRNDSIYRIWGGQPELDAYEFTTADDFVVSTGLSRVDFVKIDVDGFDLEVLRGAEKLLERFNPWVLVELNHALNTRGQSASQALLWLYGQGYRKAFVMDGENFLLRRDSEASDGLNLVFDREPIVMPPSFTSGQPLEGAILPELTLHNSSTSREGDVHFNLPKWAYVASWQIAPGTVTGPAILTINARIDQGRISFGCVATDFAPYVSKEIVVDSAPGQQIVRVSVPDAYLAAYLIARNVGDDHQAGCFQVISIEISAAVPTEYKQDRVMTWTTTEFPLAAVPQSLSSPTINIVDVAQLGDVLGFDRPYIPERELYRYGLVDFKTEVDESGIYKYIYRNFRPSKHLEFGTWEGFGVVLCASSCEAEIWTVNLPEGERDRSGAPLYSRQALPDSVASSGPGDAGDRIGWRYRAAGYESRVHQVLCDSRAFPSDQFNEGFFDSILIDGGHTADVMANDTDKALRLLRPGGLMIWHDFCPDPAALQNSEAGRGVMEGWIANHDRWRPYFSKLFWVRPSWLLIGIKV